MTDKNKNQPDVVAKTRIVSHLVIKDKDTGEVLVDEIDDNDSKKKKTVINNAR